MKKKEKTIKQLVDEFSIFKKVYREKIKKQEFKKKLRN